MARGMINVVSDEFVTLSNKLERIGRAELPVAVRGTLNQMAFDMKGTSGKRGEIDKRAEKDFDYRRNKALFKVLTGVNKASGLDISKMESEAGIVNKSGLNKVAEGLAQQQKGGETKQGATPLSRSRTGKNIGRKVRKPSYLQNMDPIDARKRKKGRFNAAAVKAKRSRRAILINGRGGVGIVAMVRFIKRKKGNIEFRINWLHRINDSGKVELSKKRPFVNNAAKEVMKGMPQEFVKQAEKRITKALSK